MGKIKVNWMYVNLKRAYFEDIRKTLEYVQNHEDPPDDLKTFELRALARNFSVESKSSKRPSIYPTRPLRFSYGYMPFNSFEPVDHIIWGEVGENIIIRDSIEEILSEVNFLKIDPRAKNLLDAIEMNKRLLGDHDNYIAFEITNLSYKMPGFIENFIKTSEYAKQKGWAGY
jgi:hypothetical protein